MIRIPDPKTKHPLFISEVVQLEGQFYNNRITTNVPAAWVASRYGGAKDTRIFNNQIIKSGSAGSDFKAIRMGWMGWKGCVAENIRFESNDISGNPFEVDATDQDHSYSVYWTLAVRITDKSGKVIDGSPVKILDKERERSQPACDVR